MISSGSQEYTTAGNHTFSVPSGVNWVSVTAVAGGAGGATTLFGGTDLISAGAGGAGESVEGLAIKCTPGGTIAITVGAGGLHGLRQGGIINATNVHSGPQGNTGAGGSGNRDSTGTSENTTVGPITLRGGYGGLRGGAPHGGMGGGWAAGLIAGNGLANNGESGNPGKPGVRKSGAARFWAGSGGGGGSLTTPGHGGPLAAWSGGAAGANGATTGGGAGGGASLYGPGGAGGDAEHDAPAVPSTSYGGGGGGGGGTATGGPALDAFLGADGMNGYVLLTWFAVT